MPVVCCTPHPCSIQETSRTRGTILSLLCQNVTGRVTWSKNGGPLPDDCKESIIDDRCSMHNEKGQTFENQRLIIWRVIRGDEGSYTCQANGNESPPFTFKISDDHNSISESPPNSTYKPIAPSGSLANVQGTNWLTEKPTKIKLRQSSQPSPHNSTTRSAPTQRSGTQHVQWNTSKSEASLQCAVIRHKHA